MIDLALKVICTDHIAPVYSSTCCCHSLPLGYLRTYNTGSYTNGALFFTLPIKRKKLIITTFTIHMGGPGGIRRFGLLLLLLLLPTAVR